MTSLLNSVLERVNFWRKLEWFVQATTGIAPKRENRRDSKPLKKRKSKSPKVAPAVQSPVAKLPATSAITAEAPIPNNSGLASHSPQTTANQAAKKSRSLKVLDSLKATVATANKSACSAAAKSGCRNCSMCKLATESA